MKDSAEYLPRAGEFDPLAGELPAGGTSATIPTTGRIHDERAAGTEAVLRILTLHEVLSYQAPVGAYLVGDGVVELGGDSLLFGPPGGFKGFAVGQLMAAGAWGHGSWLGFPVNSKFSSLWLNCENRRRRLRDQFAGMSLPPDASDRIFVTDIPSVWNLADPRLAGPIRQTIVERNIKLLIVDTVSCLTEDELRNTSPPSLSRSIKCSTAWSHVRRCYSCTTAENQRRATRERAVY